MPINENELIEVLKEIKREYEGGIRVSDEEKLSRIRSQDIINKLREFVVRNLENYFPLNWIHKEQTIYGALKTKKQDILIRPSPPIIGKKQVYVETLATINIRSQMSSIEKNFDTLYERFFAEALNLHDFLPHLVSGYIYLIPLIGYDEKKAKQEKVIFSEEYDLEKYIRSFQRINNRQSPSDEAWKHERIALLIVDFQKDLPEIIKDANQLVKENRINSIFLEQCNLKSISIINFFDDFMDVVKERYYEVLKK